MMTWVHCHPHGAVHQVRDSECWCGVVQRAYDRGDLYSDPDVTILEAFDRETAEEECRENGLWLHRDRVASGGEEER